MATRSREAGPMLAAVLALTACTTDFGGYRLEPSVSEADGARSNGGRFADGGSHTQDGGGHEEAGSAAGSRSGRGGSGGSGRGGAFGTSSGGAPSTGGGMDGGGVTFENPSCQGLARTCGPLGSDSCCAEGLVPGGTYDRDGTGAFPATVSDFVLDTYEITVGRFRKFVGAYARDMTPSGSGKNPNDPGGDPGWNVAWNQNLPADALALGTALSCTSTYQTWTPTVATHESRPITCLSWYEAYAFCVWDGGRLPTEAEWNYAAAGGKEERLYPWGAAAPDDTLTVFCGGSCGSSQNVGTKSPKGDGRWGHADLAGNAWEWNADFFVSPYPAGGCTDCVTTTTSATRVFRGASFGNHASYLLAAARFSRAPADHNGYIGARCARSP